MHARMLAGGLCRPIAWRRCDPSLVRSLHARESPVSARGGRAFASAISTKKSGATVRLHGAHRQDHDDAATKTTLWRSRSRRHRRSGAFTTTRRAIPSDGGDDGGRDDEASTSSSSSLSPPSSSSSSNELLREQLRSQLEKEKGNDGEGKDIGEAGGGDDDDDDGDEKAKKKRRYRIIVRGEEVLRYTLPDFFPDFNPTPLVSRDAAGDRPRPTTH